MPDSNVAGGGERIIHTARLNQEEQVMHRDRKRKAKAFTLAELLITLIVTSILLSALATLAYALSSATSTEDDTATVQAQLRQGTLRLQDLVWNCRLICAIEGNALAIWRADDNEDGQINVDELVYLDAGDAADALCLWQFTSATDPHVTLSSGSLSLTKSELISAHNGDDLPLIPDAQNVAFTLDATPPGTRRLTVAFDLAQNDSTRHYQINITLRAWAGHLLNTDGDTLVSDDDE